MRAHPFAISEDRGKKIGAFGIPSVLGLELLKRYPKNLNLKKEIEYARDQIGS